ncbi:MAG: helix-hairpin-helix domain-containing protein [Akkermansiaceae bacterium]
MNKASHDTDRSKISDFEQIINIGPKIADQFREIGLISPQDLKGNDPFLLYKKINKSRKQFVDPCVQDRYMSAIDFMNGNPPKLWWEYTKERKKSHTEIVDSLR